MGQKVNPRGFRIGPVFSWSSTWFATGKNYRQLLFSDIGLRQELMSRLKSAGLALVEIDRSINKIKITLHVSRPGVVIGRGGSGLEDLKKYIEKFLRTHSMVKDPYQPKGSAMARNFKVEVDVEPVKEPNLNAYLV